MKVSVEISFYPLHEEFGTPILQFIDKLNGYNDLTVETNNMSTQIFGEYGIVMDVLKKEIQTSFSEEEIAVMVLKIVNKDLR